MMGHNVSFYGKICKIIPKLSVLPYLSKLCKMMNSVDPPDTTLVKIYRLKQFKLVCYVDLLMSL